MLHLVCDNAEMIASMKKSEVFYLSRKPDHVDLQVWVETLKHVEKFKFLVITCSGDSRQNKELDTQIGKSSAVIKKLQRSTVMKRDLYNHAKLFIAFLFFYPHL